MKINLHPWSRHSSLSSSPCLFHSVICLGGMRDRPEKQKNTNWDGHTFWSGQHQASIIVAPLGKIKFRGNSTHSAVNIFASGIWRTSWSFCILQPPVPHWSHLKVMDGAVCGGNVGQLLLLFCGFSKKLAELRLLCFSGYDCLFTRELLGQRHAGL